MAGLESSFTPSNWGKPLGYSGPEELVADPATKLTKRYTTSAVNQQQNFAGYVDPNTGAKFSGYSTPPTVKAQTNWGKISAAPAVAPTINYGKNLDTTLYQGLDMGRTIAQSAAQAAQFSPVEFFLGASPLLRGVDFSGPMGYFRNVFNQINSGVNPDFFVDTNKLALDAKEAAKRLNLSPGEIKRMIAGINPSISEVTSQAASAAAALNDPSKISAQAGQMAKALNQKYIDEFDSAMPGYKQNMQKTNEITSNYLVGKIPQDVVDQIFRNSAAKGFTTGLYGGGLGRNIVARDLGLTSLQLQSSGAALLDQTAKLAATMARETMPVSGAEFTSQLITNPSTIFSTISQYNHVDPTSIFNSVYVKPSDIYNNMANMAQQSTIARANFEASKMIAPGQVFAALTDQALYNSQIANSNALNAWQSQALPGQFDITTGKYVGFKPGERLDYRPTPPGYQIQLPEAPAPTTPTAAQKLAALQRPKISSNFNPRSASALNARYVEELAANTAAYYRQKESLEAQVEEESRQAQQQAQERAREAQQMAFNLQNWTGSAYRPQMRG